MLLIVSVLTTLIVARLTGPRVRARSTGPLSAGTRSEVAVDAAAIGVAAATAMTGSDQAAPLTSERRESSVFSMVMFLLGKSRAVCPRRRGAPLEGAAGVG